MKPCGCQRPRPAILTLCLTWPRRVIGLCILRLLAPTNVRVDDARAAIANQTLSIGIVPALAGDIPPLQPLRTTTRRAPSPNLIYEIPDVQPDVPVARYTRLRVLQQPDVFTATGIVQVELPGASQLQTWAFSEPLDEGTDDFPPRLEDEEVRKRLVTWVRMRLPAPDQGEGRRRRKPLQEKDA